MKIYEVRTVYQTKRPSTSLGTEDRSDDIMLTDMISVQLRDITADHRGVKWTLAGVVLCHEYKYRLIFEGTMKP